MGLFGDILNTAQRYDGIGMGISSGLQAGIGNAVGSIFGLGYNQRLKKQIKAQKQLMDHSAKLSYDYNELAAQNAFQRQMEMYERSYQDQSYSAMRKQMEDAGLSVGLMYGGSGSGGGEGSTSGAPQGQATVSGGNANASIADIVQMGGLGLQLKGLQKDLQLKDAQINEINATAEAKRAEAGLTSEKKITEIQSREAFIEELKQRGMSEWIKNVQERWKSFAGKDWGGTEGETNKYGEKNDVYGFYGIAENSYVREEQAVKIAKAWADTHQSEASGQAAKALAELNSARANGYWQELLNATMHAEADKTRAAAAKLAAEFETGEYTNWKTWLDVAKTVAGTVGGVTTPIAIMKK